MQINKLKCYNTHPNTSDWRIYAFLTNRLQRVRMNDSYSGWAKVLNLMAFLKAMYLGPFLILLYINDLPKWCHSHSDVFLFADDSKLFRYIERDMDTIGLQHELN